MNKVKYFDKALIFLLILSGTFLYFYNDGVPKTLTSTDITHIALGLPNNVDINTDKIKANKESFYIFFDGIAPKDVLDSSINSCFGADEVCSSFGIPLVSIVDSAKANGKVNYLLYRINGAIENKYHPFFSPKYELKEQNNNLINFNNVNKI